MFPEQYVQPEDGSDSLIDIDGNAFSIMGYVTRTLRRAGNPASVLDDYRNQAMSGDYDNLLAVSMAYLDGDEGMLKNLSERNLR